MREMMASRALMRRLHELFQNAIDAEADAVFLLVGFEMDVTGPGLHGFPQDGIDQLDDGRLFGGRLQLGQRCLFLLVDGFAIVGVAVVAESGHHRTQVLGAGVGVLLGGVVGVLNGLQDGGFVSPERLDVVPGDELQVIQSAVVGGVDHGDLEGSSGAPQARTLYLRATSTETVLTIFGSIT